MTDERKIDRSELLDFRATLRAAVNAATKRLSYLPFGEVSAIIKTLEGQVDELDDILGGLMGGCEGCDSPLYATDEYYTDEDGCSTCMECAPTDEDLEPTPQQGAEIPEGFTAWEGAGSYGTVPAGLARDQFVEVYFGDGGTHQAPAYDFCWQYDRDEDAPSSCIIAYRILESEDAEGFGAAVESDMSPAEAMDVCLSAAEPSQTGGEEDGPLATPESSDPTRAESSSGPTNADFARSETTDNSSSSDSDFLSDGEPISPAPEEPTPAARFWGKHPTYQPASEEQKQGSTEAQSPLTDDQLTQIGKGA